MRVPLEIAKLPSRDHGLPPISNRAESCKCRDVFGHVDLTAECTVQRASIVKFPRLVCIDTGVRRIRQNRNSGRHIERPSSASKLLLLISKIDHDPGPITAVIKAHTCRG